MTEEADLCIICYSELDCSGSITYSLPECGHTFHQNCIMHWFRQANSKCPLCNNTGPFNGHPNDQRARWNYPFERYKVLRRLSKKKDAPKDLVKGIKLIKKNEQKLVDLRKQLKDFKKTEIVIDGITVTKNDIIKEHVALKNKKNRVSWKIRQQKRSLADKLNISPIILVEKVSV